MQPEPSSPTTSNPGAQPLKNPKHERFAHLIAKGTDVTDAFEKIGNARNPSNARRLLGRELVKQRVEYLREQVVLQTVYDAAWIKDRLAQHAANLTEVIIDEDTGAKKPGPLFNASAGNKALELLGREHGMFKEKIELGGQVQVQNRELFSKLTPEERAKLRAMLQTAAARMPAPANENEGDGHADEAADAAG